VQSLLKYLEPQMKVFDVGCGVGAFVYAMKLAGFEVSGCDFSQVSIAAGCKVLQLSEQDIFLVMSTPFRMKNFT
jgi:ribosomal protein L11 methylase PrmA